MKKITEITAPTGPQASGRVDAIDQAIFEARAEESRMAAYTALQAEGRDLQDRISNLAVEAIFDVGKKSELTAARARLAEIEASLAAINESRLTIADRLERLIARRDHEVREYQQQKWEADRDRIAALVGERYLPILEQLATVAAEIERAAADVTGPPGCSRIMLPMLAGASFTESEEEHSELTRLARFAEQWWGIRWSAVRPGLSAPRTREAGRTRAAEDAAHGARTFAAGPHAEATSNIRRFVARVASIAGSGFPPPAA